MDKAREFWLSEGRIYPLTIVMDRYGGVYSGGAYTAWNMSAWDVPDEIASGDLICGAFWDENEEPVGRGDTPEAAVRDLERRLAENALL